MLSVVRILGLMWHMRRDHLYIFRLMSCIFVVLEHIEGKIYNDLYYYSCKLISNIV